MGNVSWGKSLFEKLLIHFKGLRSCFEGGKSPHSLGLLIHSGSVAGGRGGITPITRALPPAVKEGWGDQN